MLDNFLIGGIAMVLCLIIQSLLGALAVSFYAKMQRVQLRARSFVRTMSLLVAVTADQTRKTLLCRGHYGNARAAANAEQWPAAKAFCQKALRYRPRNARVRSLLATIPKLGALKISSDPTGAIVSINGVRVKVNNKGQFKTVVPLKEGKNDLSVEAEDVQGKHKIVSLPTITVDSKAPSLRSDVTWGD